MKKLTIIATLLLISITSHQMNCMDAWTDPYGLDDENQAPTYASIGTNTEELSKILIAKASQTNTPTLITKTSQTNSDELAPILLDTLENKSNLNSTIKDTTKKLSNGVKVGIQVYVIHNEKILLTNTSLDDEESWSLPSGLLIPGIEIKKFAQKIIYDQTGLNLDNIGYVPGYVESISTLGHYIMLIYSGSVLTDNPINNEKYEYKWFSIKHLPDKLSTFTSRDSLNNNIWYIQNKSNLAF